VRVPTAASARGRYHAHNKRHPFLEFHVKVLLSQSEDAISSFGPGQTQHWLKCSQPYLEFHANVLLGQSRKRV